MLNQTLTIELLKKDFPIFSRKINDKIITYLDSSSTSQKPIQVLDSQEKFYKEYNANIHRGVYKLSEEATKAYEEAHKQVASLINASAEEVIFTSGTTASLNLLAYSLCKTLKPGDEIVISQLEHHANLVPWQQLAKQYNLKLKFINIDSECKLDLKHAESIITDKTKIVSICHISNAVGTINPIKDICKLAHKHNALFIVDAAQSVPHIPVDVKDLDVDFLAFSGHKMLAPTGTGVLYGKKHLLENLSPFLYGGDMISEVKFEDSTWNELPWKFEAGTPNISGGIALGIAAEYLKKAGLENIQRHVKEVSEYAVERLSMIRGLTIYGPKDPKDRAGIISFNIEGIHAHDVATILDREGVCVRGGHHCAMPLMNLLNIQGTVRASFYLYNTFDDVEVLYNALENAKKVFNV